MTNVVNFYYCSNKNTKVLFTFTNIVFNQLRFEVILHMILNQKWLPLFGATISYNYYCLYTTNNRIYSSAWLS